MRTRFSLLVVFLLLLSGCTRNGGGDADSVEFGAWGVDLSARDESVAPGDDFNRYANGRWLDTFEIPTDLSSYGSFIELRLDAEEDVRLSSRSWAPRRPKTARWSRKSVTSTTIGWTSTG